MKRRDLVRALERAGFRKIRSGKHDIFARGDLIVPVPRHTEINEHTARGILRDAGIG